MAIASIGSIADRLQNRVDDIPLSISGAVLIGMVDERRIFMEGYLGKTIGSIAIIEKYQPPLTSLTRGDLLSDMALTGADATKIKLGDFEIQKGTGSNLDQQAKSWEAKGMKQLKSLGKRMPFKQVLG